MNEKEVEKYIDKLYELENYDVVKKDLFISAKSVTPLCQIHCQICFARKAFSPCAVKKSLKSRKDSSLIFFLLLVSAIISLLYKIKISHLTKVSYFAIFFSFSLPNLFFLFFFLSRFFLFLSPVKIK